MSSLAEFLKGTVSDSLKKLLQPAGLLPAALFVLLNLAFVYPAAAEEQIPIALDYKGLAEIWQATVLGVLILGLGVLLLSAGSFVLDTLSGRTWRAAIGYGLFGVLRNFQRSWLTGRIERLAKAEPQGVTRRESIQLLRWRLRSRFAPPHEHPPDDRRSSSATSLGDALRASNWMTTDRYGLDMTVLWEPLRAAIGKPGEEPDPSIAAADDEEAVLNLVGNLTFVLWFFAVESVVVLSLLQHWGAVPPMLLVLPIAFLAYRVTVTKAISWSDAVDTVVALHRDKLRDAHGLDKPATPADERKLFRELSYFARWGGDGAGPVTPAAPQAASASCSANATAELRGVRWRTPADVRTLHRSNARHHLLVTRLSTGADRESACVLITDPSVPRVRNKPVGAEAVLPGEAAKPDAVAWVFDELERGATRTERYDVPRWCVELHQGAGIEVEEPSEESLHITVHGPIGPAGRLELWHMLGGSRVLVWMASRPGLLPLAAASGNRRTRWDLPQLGANETLNMAVHFRAAEAA